jgi:hypoxanthine phosphoribosyltransferase
MLLSQSEKICQTPYKPDIIVAIAQGGTIPMRILTDILNPPQTTTIQIELYTSIAHPNTQPTLKQPLTVPVNDKKILLVDDISDSGQTLNLAKQHLTEKGATEIKTATLYAKPTTQTPPNYAEKTTTNWVVFPWEIKETLQNILKKHKKDDIPAINNEFTKLIKAGMPNHLLKHVLKTLPEL